MFKEIRVKTVIDNIYKDYGLAEKARGSCSDPDSKNTLETISRRKAYRALPSSDRVAMTKAINNICDKTNMGTDAALSMLMRLGIFLSTYEKRRIYD